MSRHSQMLQPSSLPLLHKSESRHIWVLRQDVRKKGSFVCLCNSARTPLAQFDKCFENMNNFKGRN